MCRAGSYYSGGVSSKKKKKVCGLLGLGAGKNKHLHGPNRAILIDTTVSTPERTLNENFQSKNQYSVELAKLAKPS